jgi:hypothetical protein
LAGNQTVNASLTKKIKKKPKPNNLLSLEAQQEEDDDMILI